jgi:hypothetical protein
VPVLAKLRQLPPSIANVLLVVVPGADARLVDVDGALRAVRQRADRKDEAYFEARGLGDSRGFYERFLRLGAVIAWAEAAAGERRTTVWVNRSARIAVPPRALRAVTRAISEGS